MSSVTGLDGRELGSIWRNRDGAVCLPFDPDEVIANYWGEGYAEFITGSTSLNDFFDPLLTILGSVGRQSVPTIAPCPPDMIRPSSP